MLNLVPFLFLYFLGLGHTIQAASHGPKQHWSYSSLHSRKYQVSGPFYATTTIRSYQPYSQTLALNPHFAVREREWRRFYDALVSVLRIDNVVVADDESVLEVKVLDNIRERSSFLIFNIVSEGFLYSEIVIQFVHSRFFCLICFNPLIRNPCGEARH